MRNATIACISSLVLALSLTACDDGVEEGEADTAPRYGLAAGE